MRAMTTLDTSVRASPALSSARRLADMRARRELIAVHMIAPIRVVCAMDERTTRSTTSRGCRRSAIAAPMIEPNE